MGKSGLFSYRIEFLLASFCTHWELFYIIKPRKLLNRWFWSFTVFSIEMCFPSSNKQTYNKCPQQTSFWYVWDLYLLSYQWDKLSSRLLHFCYYMFISSKVWTVTIVQKFDNYNLRSIVIPLLLHWSFYQGICQQVYVLLEYFVIGVCFYCFIKVLQQSYM